MKNQRIVIGDRNKKNQEWGFTKCAVLKKDRAYIMSFLKENEDKGIYITQILQWEGGTFSNWLVEWATGSVCATTEPEPLILTMGLGGRVHVASAAGFNEEEIDPTEEGPPYRGMLREARNIGEYIYVAGMGRQVYKRTASGNWQRADKGVLISKGKVKGSGFNSIHGFSDNEIYAAGWSGEIWFYDGNVWQQIDSPTNVNLQRVVCAPSESVFACGQKGILLKGYKNSWSVIDHGATQDDFWGMTWFQDKLWIATLDALYTLNDKDGLDNVKMGEGPRLTCGWLDANDEVLWSVGSQDMAYYDGTDWFEPILP